MSITLDDDFPRAYAQTDRFRRGVPRTFEVTDQHVTFLRSAGPTDAVLSLWRFDLASKRETLLVDAASLHADDADLPPAERARRERQRESGAGITSYSQSDNGDRIAFSAGSALWCWDAIGLRALDVGAVFDPRIDPTGEFIAFVADGSMRMVRFTDGEPVHAISLPGRTVGIADFAAAEELERSRGYWWSPSGQHLLAEIVDDSAVQAWHISDPTHPELAPREHRYPQAGTANAACSLLLLDVASGQQQEIRWDATKSEYLVSVRWKKDGPALITLADRLQTRFETFSLSLDNGNLTSVHVIEATPWVDVIPGVPAWLPDGRLVHATHHADHRALAIDGHVVTPDGFDVASVESTGANGIVVGGSSDPRTPTALHIDLEGRVTPLSEGFTHAQFASNGRVHVRALLDGATTGRMVDVMVGDEVVAALDVLAESARMPSPHFTKLGKQSLNAVILWPEQDHPGPLPIVLSPYGGPHHLEVVAAAGSFAEDQWLANQGFCVLIADGRGTPGRGLAWERAVHHRFAEVTLEDQVEALDALVALHPDRVDPTRVGIRGWSYGGYLSALALLARSDLFHVGIAGAPVTDWTLYDTAYTERYLGDPRDEAECYEINGLLHLAPNLRGRLMIIHGLADDNVAAAHSLRLSAALLAAGKQHEFLPLAGVSHMTPQAMVTENLMRLQAKYLAEHLRG